MGSVVAWLPGPYLRCKSKEMLSKAGFALVYDKGYSWLDCGCKSVEPGSWFLVNGR